VNCLHRRAASRKRKVYVGAEEAEDHGQPFEEKMKLLTAKLEEQFADSAALEQAIRRNLAMLDF